MPSTRSKPRYHSLRYKHIKMWADIALIIGAYLLGAAPHLAALGKLRGVKLDGDLHINLWRRGGRLIGLLGILLEFAKGVTPVLVGKHLGFSLLVVALAGLAVVIGQMWPVFSRFDGEKGNSIGIGMAGALAPLPLAVAVIFFATGALTKALPRLWKSRSLNEWTRFESPPSLSLPLAMAIGFLVLPVASWLLAEPPVITAGFSALFILIMVRRLTAGLKADLTPVKTSLRSILLNRLLFDRSYL